MWCALGQLEDLGDGEHRPLGSLLVSSAPDAAWVAGQDLVLIYRGHQNGTQQAIRLRRRQGGALRRRWPGVSGGLCLGGPPAARRAAGWRGRPVIPAHITRQRAERYRLPRRVGARLRSLVEGAERSR
jgi:hypothetical protein